MLFVVAAGAAVVYGRVQSGDDARDGGAGRRALRRAAGGARDRRAGSRCCSRRSRAPRPTPGSRRRSRSPEDCGLSFGGTDAYTTGHLDLVRDGRLGGLLVAEARPPSATTRARRGWRDALREPAAAARRSPIRGPGKQVVLATAPVPKLGLVLASFNLDGVGRSLRDNYGGPRGLEFVLADQRAGRSSRARSTRSAGSGARSRSTATRGCTRARRSPASAGRCTPAPIAPRRSRRRSALNRRELTIILAGLALFLLADGDRAPARRAAAGPARTARSAARRPPPRRRRSRVAGPGRGRLARAPAQRARAPPPRAGGLPRRVRRQPAADVGARHRHAPHPRGQRRRPSPPTATRTTSCSRPRSTRSSERRACTSARTGSTIEVNVASHAIDFRGRDGVRRDRRGRHREGAAAAPAPAVAAAREPRPARGRRRARLQQPAGGDPRLRVVHRAPRGAGQPTTSAT